MHGRQIGDSFFRFFPTIRINNLDAISYDEGIEEIDQSNLVILIETASGSAVLERPFNDEITKGEDEALFEFMKDGQAIVGGVVSTTLTVRVTGVAAL